MTEKTDDRGSRESQLSLKKEAFPKAPIILAAALYFALTIFLYADVSTFYIFMSVLAALIVAAIFLIIGIVQRQYMSVLFTILSTAFLIFVLPSAPYVAYYIKFTLHEKQYLEEIKMVLPDEKGFRYKEFNWGHGSADRTALIYDESDEFELPEAKRSKSWREMMDEHSGILLCPSTVYKMKPHLFVVVEDCP